MKFNKKTYTYGEVRTKTWFAWLPITIKYETRWLEKVSVKQVFGLAHWFNIEFVD